MPASEFLKSFRDKGYSSSGKSDMTGPDNGSDAPETSRVIKFTDDEQKMFEQAKPGEDLACEVHGKLDGEGGFRVMSVAPLGGGSSYGDDEQKMAGQVAQRVMPTVQLSPS